MNQSWKTHLVKLLSMGLALCTLSGCVACAKKDTPKPPDTSAGSSETTTPVVPPTPTPPPSEELFEVDTEGKPLLNAGFEGRKKTSPLFFGIGEGVSVGASWNPDGVNLFLRSEAGNNLSVTLGKSEHTLSVDASKEASVAVSFEQMNCRLTDLGQLLALKISDTQSGSGLFDGFLKLMDYESFIYADFSESKEPFGSATLSAYGSNLAVKDADAGVDLAGGGLHIFDRFTADGKNRPYLRCQVRSVPLPKLEFSTTKRLLTEFDITVASMPVYPFRNLDANTTPGLSFAVSEADGGESFLVGLLRTQQGLAVYLNGKNPEKNTDTSDLIPIGKQLGERFRLSFLWESSRITVLVDGNPVGGFDGVNIKRNANLGNQSVNFIWQRNDAPAKSKDDSFEAVIDNFCMAYVKDYRMIETLTPESLLGKDYRRMDGDSVYLASKDLDLPGLLENSKYGLSASVIWKTSDEAIMSAEGIRRKLQGAGELVTLTAYLADGGSIVSKKEFNLFVKAANPDSKVLWVKNDSDPFSGVGTFADSTYSIDGNNNSIIYDMGEVTAVNRASVVSLNPKNRIGGNFTALYYSEDNRTYKAIPEYCTLHKDGNLYFYNFHVEARYIKVHFTYAVLPELSLALFNSLQKAMTAGYSKAPLLDGGKDFAKQVTVSSKNSTDKTVYNKIETYTLQNLGIDAKDLQSDLSDIRFRCDGYELPHYYANGRFYVRVVEIGANKTVEIRVSYGNPSAENISDGIGTLEVEYGTKTVSPRPAGEGVAWRNSVTVMPDGSLIAMGPYDGNSYLGMERSEDGGHNWSKTQKIPGTKDLFQGGGFIVDYENNVVYYLAYSKPERKETAILQSLDSGKTWETVQILGGGIRLVTYSDGIKLSRYDGAGAGVDYVFPVVYIDGEPDGKHWSHSATSVYSKDGGKTWAVGDTKIHYGSIPQRNYWDWHEAGVTESSIWEKKDGTLMMYSRYQGYDEVNKTLNLPHFVVTYSYDGGVTWKDSKLSTVYTSNTQPILDSFHGTPILLWGGNNAGRYRSYDRFPLNVAYSADDAENFISIQDISFQTELSNRIEYRPAMEKWIITNPDIALFEQGGVDCAYMVTTNYRILIENFKNYLYKTKGAFDSFEAGSMEADGWTAISGAPGDPHGEPTSGELPTLSKTGATDGDWALHLGSDTKVSRSVPYAKKGELFFDYYVETLGSGTAFELQTAYRREEGVAAPIRFSVRSDGNVYYYNAENILVNTSLKVKEGENNHFSVTFDGETGKASLELNGKTSELFFDKTVGDYICFVNVLNGYKTVSDLDCFGLMSN